jgi:predicted glycogen debranching enzyme
MADLIRKLPERDLPDPDADPHLREEWLVTNGLGGYASGTVRGDITRRYHGLLIAALPNPLGRTMMLNALSERLRLPDRRIFYIAPGELGGAMGEQVLHPVEFHLQTGLPVWRYEVGGFVLEKRLFLSYRQNTVRIAYRIVQGDGALRIGLRPAIHFRSHDDAVGRADQRRYVLTVHEDQFEITGGNDFPPLHLQFHAPCSAFTFDRKKTGLIPYATERNRGYEWQGSLWSPGYFRSDMEKGQTATLTASTERWEAILAMTPEAASRSEMDRRRLLLSAAPPELQDGIGAEWTLAADQFLVTPAGRIEDAARARAQGDEIRTVIAGYHWFTDWGRDTMISLEGLTLATGRINEAAWILRTFAQYVRDGLIPNMFPEGNTQGLYHTADATLWYFHAIQRYVEYTGDHTTLELLLPRLVEIIVHHMRGTRFGIGVDPEDGLLRQGEEGYQLTWMDAKVGDWVVTPRRGKAVEINALWYNALRLAEKWLRQEEHEADANKMGEAASRVHRSFNARFWNAAGGYLYDVVDAETGGNDDACRPNQIMAISLDFPVLDRHYWKPVMDVVTERLLTPVGLRSLAPDHPDYKPRYYGDLRSRDAAYHQGTVWAWLIGPYIDAFLKLYPDQLSAARKMLEGFVPHLAEQCIGSISEIFDADPPYTPRGCIAQAWSVAEVLRCWLKTGLRY